MRVIKDGWHYICGYKCYVENGKVLRGILYKPACGQVPVYPYRYNRKTKCWDLEIGIGVNALRAGLMRSTIDMK